MASMRKTLIIALVILLGLALGLTYGWLINPVAYTDTEIVDLKEAYQIDYVLMVSDAYALTGDLDAARERLSYLKVSDPASIVLFQAESALAAGTDEAQASRLARLAAALGASSPAISPYLTPTPAAP